MTYAILTIALLIITCAWLRTIVADAEAERDRQRELYADAMNALAQRQADIDEREAVIARQMEVIGALRDVRDEYVVALLDGRIVERSWQKWTN